MTTYCSKYFLLTPRNGRRKFRSPVQIPSSVLQCTSRTPSPSSSRAYSPRLWLTDACPRPCRGRDLYTPHSSVYTIAPALVAGRTVWWTNSAGQLGGRGPLGEPADDQQDLGGGAVGPLPGRAGEQIEHPSADLAAVIDDWRAVAPAVDVVAVAPASAARTSQAVGVEQIEEPT